MANNNYLEKLKDPRWQRKRLEIFERDRWRCQLCQDSDETLIVHHRLYLNGQEPWDYPNELLITLCESCHQTESINIPTIEKNITYYLKAKFLSWGLHELYEGFYKIELQHCQEVVAGAYSLALSDPKIQDQLICGYFKQLKRDGIKLLKSRKKQNQKVDN